MEGTVLFKVFPDGREQQVCALPLGPPYSMEAHGEKLLLVYRLQNQAVVVDLNSGVSLPLPVVNTRPRQGVFLDTGTWVIVHDTTPDWGITTGDLLGSGEYFSYGAPAFPSAIMSGGNNTAFVGHGNGRIMRVDMATHLVTASRVPPGVDRIIDLKDTTDGGLWVASTIRGTVHYVSQGLGAPSLSFGVPWVRKVIPAPYLNGFWAVTATSLTLY
jgi:hypothetical protein